MNTLVQPTNELATNELPKSDDALNFSRLIVKTDFGPRLILSGHSPLRVLALIEEGASEAAVLEKHPGLLAVEVEACKWYRTHTRASIPRFH